MERMTKIEEMEKNMGMNLKNISETIRNLENDLKHLQKDFNDFKVEMAKLPLKLIIISSVLVSTLTGLIIYFLG
jgi:archaellum component FlaC